MLFGVGSVEIFGVNIFVAAAIVVVVVVVSTVVEMGGVVTAEALITRTLDREEEP
jgi:hypothetical protein